MKLLKFTSSYQEDSRIIGCFNDDQDELIQEFIKSEIDLDRNYHPNSPSRYQQNSFYYSIEDVPYYGKILVE